MEAGMGFEYESVRLAYVGKVRHYKPDFNLANGIILEVKGRFTGADRAKHLAVREAHPELDIRFVFQRDNPIVTGSKTKYSDWCEKNGFLYCFNNIPEEWLYD